MFADGRRHVLLVISSLLSLPVCAQGSENAIGAAVVFGAVVFAAVVAGLVISIVHLFKRRTWQRIVMLLFGLVLSSRVCGSARSQAATVILNSFRCCYAPRAWSSCFSVRCFVRSLLGAEICLGADIRILGFTYFIHTGSAFFKTVNAVNLPKAIRSISLEK